MKRSTAIAIAAVAFLQFAVFFFYPALAVVKRAFVTEHGNWTLSYITAALQHPVYREGLWNALLLGVASTLLSLLIALPLALLNQRQEFVGKRWLELLLLAPMILPPFVGAIGMKQILGTHGSLNALLENIGLMNGAQPIDWLRHGRLAGIIVLNALHLYPILYLNIRAALNQLDPAMELAAANLGCPPWRRFLRITLPLAMPGIFAGASIVFIAALTELGTPLVFDFQRVTPVQIYDGIKGIDNNPLPFALAAILLGVAATAFASSKLLFRGRMSGRSQRPKSRPRSARSGGTKAAACIAANAGLIALACVPHASVILLALSASWYGGVLPDAFTLRHFSEALGNGLVVPSIQNSLLYATAATAFATALGLAIAWVVVRSRLRVRGLLDAMVMLPLAMPGLVIAFGYLALSQEGKPFHALVGAGGNPFLLLAIAYGIRRLPYIARAAVAGLQQSNPELEQAAQVFGAPPRRVLQRVALPLIGGHVFAGAILVFAFSMLEVSDSLILAQQTQHYPITKAIYTLLSTLGNGTELAAALGVWAMAFLAIAIAGTKRENAN